MMTRLRSLPLPGAVGTLLLLMAPLIVVDPYWRHVYCVIAFYGLAAVGLNIVAGYADQLSLGHGAFALIGAYTSAYMSTRHGWPIVFGVLLGMAISAVVGLVIGALCLRLTGLYFALVTAAANLIVVSVISQLKPLGAANGFMGVPGFSNSPANVPITMILFGVVISAVSWLIYGVTRSHVGRSLAAVRRDPLLAASIGVKVAGVKLVAFTASAVVTSVAGSFYVHWQGTVTPNIFDLEYSLTLLLLVFFGGAGTIAGPVVGAMAISALPEILPLSVTAYVPFIYGGVLLVVIAYIPRGVVGTVVAGMERVLELRRRRGGGHLAPPVSDVLPLDGPPLPEVLSVANATKAFGGLRALDDVGLEVRPGEVHCLIGPNGSGKSTMIDVISGVVRSDAGTVGLGARGLTNVDIAGRATAGIARTFQGGRILAEATVLENVLLGAHHRFSSPAWASVLHLPGARREERAMREAALNVLGTLGLVGVAGQRAHALSAGHQRMIEIARAAMARPRALLLDEPAAGLANFEIDLLLECVVRMRNAGIGILLVEHHLEMVMSIADVITVLDSGRTIASGSPDDVKESPAVVAAYLGADFAH